MKCDLTDSNKLLADYINEILSEKDREKFEEHCFNCEICFQELKLKNKKIGLAKQERDELYADYLKKLTALEKLCTTKPGFFKSFITMLSQTYRERSYRFVYATVATATIVILCFFIYKSTTYDNIIRKESYLSAEQDSSQAKPKIAEKEDSIIIKEPEHFATFPKRGQEKEINDIEEIREEEKEIDTKTNYAANFTAYPIYEYAIDEATRSTDYSMNVLSPKISEDVKDSLQFRWETDYKGPLYLEIFTNRDSLIFNEQPKDNKLVFADKLKPGLYYWKLISKDDLFYIGKFFVGKGE